MSIRKPGFITKNTRGGRTTTTRPYKWGPGIPSLAIKFNEIPVESLNPQQFLELQNLLGTQDFFPITTQDGYEIVINIH